LSRSSRRERRLEKLLGREDAQPGSRELDRERQALETPAELAYRLRGLGLRSLAEERDGVGLAHRRELVHQLAVEPEALAARAEEREPRTVLDEIRKILSGGREVLEVVQEQECMPALEVRGEGLERASPRVLADREGLSDRGQDEGRVAKRSEEAREQAVAEVRLRAAGELEHLTGLARTTWAGDGEEARLAQELRALGELGLAAEEA
jgi:hypothetical protein